MSRNLIEELLSEDDMKINNLEGVTNEMIKNRISLAYRTRFKGTLLNPNFDDAVKLMIVINSNKSIPYDDKLIDRVHNEMENAYRIKENEYYEKNKKFNLNLRPYERNNFEDEDDLYQNSENQEIFHLICELNSICEIIASRNHNKEVFDRKASIIEELVALNVPEIYCLELCRRIVSPHLNQLLNLKNDDKIKNDKNDKDSCESDDSDNNSCNSDDSDEEKYDEFSEYDFYALEDQIELAESINSKIKELIKIEKFLISYKNYGTCMFKKIKNNFNSYEQEKYRERVQFKDQIRNLKFNPYDPGK